MDADEKFVSIAASRLLHWPGGDDEGEFASSAKLKNRGDPVVPFWRDWRRVHEQRVMQGNRVKYLETELAQLAGGFPRVEIRSQSVPSEQSVFAISADEIDELLPCPEYADENSRAKGMLEARRYAWENANAAVGYSAVCEQHAAISDREETLAEAMLAIAATSIAGVAAKLYCLIEMENPDACLREAPWPQLSSILADLVSLSETAGMTGPGCENASAG